MYKEKGLVLKFERFAIHDGPGIRTVVFLKGCPLRCVWCSSPESQNAYPEIAYFENRCIGHIECGSCLRACSDAVSVNTYGKLRIDWSKCTNCGKCAKVCCSKALEIEGQFMTPSEVRSEVERDYVFYKNSGGGVTISGGEPLMQWEFTKGLLEIIHEQGIHTAIETSSYCKWKNFKKVLMHTDLAFLDIKHMNPRKHLELTGVTNELILENIRKIDQECAIPCVICFPLVHTVNDSEENLVALFEFVRKLSRTDTVKILPYHRLGIHMYKALGREYKLEKIEVSSVEYMEEVKDMVKSYGLIASKW